MAKTTKTLPGKSTAMPGPPENSEAVRLLHEVPTPGRDKDGNAILRRALTAVERKVLENRAAVLAPFVERARPADVEEAVLAMMVGLSSGQSEGEADMTAGQYAMVCCSYGLPLWSIQRACLRFAAGDVTFEEVGEKRTDRRLYPSSARVRILAEKVARPIFDEARWIASTLRGTVAVRPREPTAAEREAALAKIQETHAAYHRGVAQRRLDEVIADAARRAAGQQFTAMNNHRMRLQEYKDAGVEPVYSDPAKTVLVSLAMLLKQGYEVRDLGFGVRALVGPAGVRP